MIRRAMRLTLTGETRIKMLIVFHVTISPLGCLVHRLPPPRRQNRRSLFITFCGDHCLTQIFYFVVLFLFFQNCGFFYVSRKKNLRELSNDIVGLIKTNLYVMYFIFYQFQRVSKTFDRYLISLLCNLSKNFFVVITHNLMVWRTPRGLSVRS